MSLSVRLDEKTNHRLSAVAHDLGRTKSAVVKQAVLEYLEEMEDIADAMTELEMIRTGKSKVHSLTVARKKLGLRG